MNIPSPYVLAQHNPDYIQYLIQEAKPMTKTLIQFNTTILIPEQIATCPTCQKPICAEIRLYGGDGRIMEVDCVCATTGMYTTDMMTLNLVREWVREHYQVNTTFTDAMTTVVIENGVSGSQIVGEMGWKEVE